jgi:hypothetical protein
MNKQKVHFLPKHNEGFECFGLCPMCGHSDNFVKMNGYVYVVCHEHMVKWIIAEAEGGNAEKDWRYQVAATYREINPFWPLSDLLPDDAA